jgi:WD40 repeat protein
MRIVFHARHQRLAVLEKTSLALWDLTTGTPVLRATTPVRNGDNANGCDAWVGVLAGKVAPAGASLRAATLHRFDWDLTALPSPVLGEVARHTLSPSADGAWVAATNWKNGRVTVFDAATGAVRGANGSSIPSGPSFSPDGLTLLAGAADQGSGAVLAFDLTAVNDGTLSMSRLPPPGRGHPGLDDAPFFSVFSRDGRYAALSNESWGGRGVCVYDMSGRAPLWSVTLPGTDEEPENWFAFQAAFTSLDRVLLLAGPRALHAFAVEDGRDLGWIPLPGDGRHGFALDEAFWRVWVPGRADGEAPVAVAIPDAWREVFGVAEPPKPRVRKKTS